MTILLVDGFDAYQSGGVDMTARGWNVSATSFDTGRLGTGKCAKFGVAFNTGSHHAITSTAAISLGVAIKMNQHMIDVEGSSTSLFTFRNGTTEVVDVRATATGALSLHSQSANFATTAALIVANVWNYLEVSLDITAQTAQVWFNGISVASVTAQNMGSSPINDLYIAGVGNLHGDEMLWLDDFYVSDSATHIGECRVDILRPVADTAAKDFVPLTGSSNYLMVNNTLIDGDTSFNSSDVVGAIDVFDAANMPVSPLAIYAVQSVVCARKDDAGTRTLRPKMKSGSTVANGAALGLSTSYACTVDIHSLDPDTSAAWTLERVNLAQVGYELVS